MRSPRGGDRPGHRVQEVAAGQRVQVRGRLVENQQFRPPGDGERERELGPLAAGQPPGPLPGVQAGLIHPAPGQAGVPARAEPLSHAQVIGHGQVPIHRRALGDEPGPLPDRDRSRRRPQQPDGQLQERCLARPVGPDQPDDLPGRHRQRAVRQGPPSPVPLAERVRFYRVVHGPRSTLRPVSARCPRLTPGCHLGPGMLVAMRVLVVEDHEVLATAVAAGLRREGMAVDLVLHGQEALGRLDGTRYDVVVLDRDLPGVHGDEVCRRITAGDSGSRVLMLTAAGTVRDKVDGLGLGADDYLAKPFDFAELVARIRALARRSAPAVPPVLDTATFPWTREGTSRSAPGGGWTSARRSSPCWSACWRPPGGWCPRRNCSTGSGTRRPTRSPRP